MSQIVGLGPVPAAKKAASVRGMSGVTLTMLETWITSSAMGGDGWGDLKRFLLIRLTSTGGVTGLGEAFVLPCREQAVAEMITALAQAAGALETVSPWSFRELAAKINARHNSLDFAAASSALEMALWDICGKLAEKPLCNLIGGNHARPVPVYGNIWSDRQSDSSALQRRAAELVAQGYRAIKIHPLHKHSVTEAVNCVASVRDAIGDDVSLMVDLDSQGEPEIALAIANMIGPQRPYWFEEPVGGEDINTLGHLREITGLRIVTGEKHSGVAHFRAVLTAGAADVLNPDIAGIGGLLDMLEVAELADLHGVKISPHCWNSMTVAAAAMLHFCTSIPNADMAEIYPEFLAHGATFAACGFHLDGEHAHLSDAPGLGVEIDTQALHSISDHYQTTCLTRMGAQR